MKNARQIIVLTKTTVAQDEDALSYYRMRGLYSLSVVFAAAIANLFYFGIISLSRAAVIWVDTTTVIHTTDYHHRVSVKEFILCLGISLLNI